MVLSAYYTDVPSIECKECQLTVEWNDGYSHACSSKSLPPPPSQAPPKTKESDGDLNQISDSMGKLGFEDDSRNKNSEWSQSNTNSTDTNYEACYEARRGDVDTNWNSRSGRNSPIPTLKQNDGRISPLGNPYPVSRRNIAGEQSNDLPICGDCKESIHNLDDGFEITALQSWYHADCFVCDVCRHPFNEQFPFVPHNSRAFCEQHYEELFLPSCAACKKPITDGRVSKAFGTYFHERHLRCNICDHQIRGRHIEYNGKIFCQADFDLLTGSDCRRCQLAIDGPSIAACGGAYHKNCFACTTCNRTFPDKKFFVHNNQPFCLTHYHEATNTLCGGCAAPIQGACVDVTEFKLRYHPDCWVCEKCKCTLTGVYYLYRGRAYCDRDIEAVYKPNSQRGGDQPSKRNTLLRS